MTGKKKGSKQNGEKTCTYRINDGTGRLCGKDLHYGDNEYCIFHSKNIEGKKAAFNEKFWDEFEDLKEYDLPYDFWGFVFPGDFSFNKEFNNDVNFSEAEFHGKVDFRDVIFSKESKVSFYKAKFSKEVNFKKVIFWSVGFEYAEFSGEAYFESAEFYRDAGFESAIFSKDINFKGAKFKKSPNFSRAKFLEWAIFTSTHFTGGAYFLAAHFSGVAYFGGAYFSGGSYIGDTKFSIKGCHQYPPEKANFQGAQLSEATFHEARFYGKADFNGAIFSEEAHFYRVEFSREADFKRTRFSGGSHFQGAQFNNVYFFEAEFFGTAHFYSEKSNEKTDTQDAHGKAKSKEVRQKTQFSGMADFKGVKFSGKADFKGAIFSGEANFNNTKFKEDADFTDIDIKNKNGIQMENTNFHNVSGLFEFIEDNENVFKKLRKRKWTLKTEFLPKGFKLILGEAASAKYPVFSRQIKDDIYLLDKNERNSKMKGIKGWGNRTLYFLWWLFADCGRSFFRWALWSVLFAVFFALIYHCAYLSDQTAFKSAYIHDTWPGLSFLYYSIVTFTTLGFGDIVPKPGWMQFGVMLEVILGYVMLGGLISILANKLARRS